MGTQQTTFQKIRKAFSRMVLVLLCLIVFLLILIRLPFFQQFLTRQAESFLRKQTHAEISIGKIRFNYSGAICLQDVFIPEQSADTLLWLHNLEVAVNLPSLLKKTISIKEIDLDGLVANLVPADGQHMNYEFLLNAFSTPSAPQDETPEKESSSSWAFSLPDATIALRHIRAQFVTVDSAYQFYHKMGELTIHTHDVDPDHGLIDLQELLLSDTDLKMVMKADSTPAAAPDSSSTSPWHILSGKILLNNVAYSLGMEDLNLSAVVQKLEILSPELGMKEADLEIDAKNLLLADGQYKMDFPSAPPADGFDYAHLDLHDIQINIDQPHYAYDLITGDVKTLSTTAADGFSIHDLSSQVMYAEDSVAIRGFRSHIGASAFAIPFAKLELGEGGYADWPSMQILAQLDQNEISPDDVLYFAPSLHEYLPADHMPIRIRGNMSGKVNDFLLDALDLQYGKSRLFASGRIANANVPDQLSADLELSDLTVASADLMKFLPKESIPDGITLPEVVQTKGHLSGSMEKLNFNLNTSLYRQQPSGFFSISGIAESLTHPEAMTVTAHIDTLWAMENELLAWIPDSTRDQFPLPDKITLAGDLYYNTDSIASDLHVHALKNSAAGNIAFNGHAVFPFDSSRLAYVAELTQLNLPSAWLASVLPEGSIPPYLALPDIISAEGKGHGNLNETSATMNMSTSAGDLAGLFDMHGDQYHLEFNLDSTDLHDLFTDDAAYDSVIGWSAPPVSVSLVADGSGFDIENHLTSRADLVVKYLGIDPPWQEGIRVAGEVDRKSFAGTISAHEHKIDLDLETFVNLNDGKDTLSVDGKINTLDLRELGLMEKPLQVSGEIRATTQGFNPMQMLASARITGLQLRQGEMKETADSISLHWAVDTAAGSFDAALKSDILQARLIDQQGHGQDFSAGVDQLTRALAIPAEDLSLDADSSRNILLEVKVTRPEFFTNGIIPGLTGLGPVELRGVVDLRDSSFAVWSNVPELKYSQIELVKSQFAAVNREDLFMVGFYIDHGKLLDAIDIDDLILGTQNVGQDSFKLVLIQQDTINTPNKENPYRFLVAANAYRENGAWQMKFIRSPIINFDSTWTFNPENIIHYSGDSLHISNLDLTAGDQQFGITEIAPDVLKLTLSNLDLSQLSDIIKWKGEYISGLTSGEVTIHHPLSDMSIEANLKGSDLAVLGYHAGTMNSSFRMEPNGDITGTLKAESPVNNLDINGQYTAETGTTEAQVTGHFHDLSEWSRILSAYTDSLAGKADLDLAVKQASDKLDITGQISLQDVLVKPDVTGSLLKISETTIDVTPSRIAPTAPIILKDSLGQEARLTFSLIPEGLPDFSFEAEASGKNFLLYNVKSSDKAIYYGTLFADFSVKGEGKASDMKLSGEITPQKGSAVTYVYDTGSEVKEIETGGGIIEFVNPKAEQDSSMLYTDENEAEDALKYALDLSLHVNHDLGVKVIVDKANGDNLEGTGEGNLSIQYTSGEDANVTGQLDVSGSKYLYTYEGLIKRLFELEEGSTLTFTGPADNPQLNLKAKYELKTSPELLVKTYGDPSDEDASRLRSRQDFLVNVQAAGTMEEAEISADITYPRVAGNNLMDLVDPSLGKLRNSTSEMNSQAFSLILINSFTLGGGDGGGPLAINLNQQMGNAVSSQLNMLAAKYINFVELDFGIDALNSDVFNFNETDFRVGIRKRLFNDRLVLEVDGKTSTHHVDIENRTVLDNISVEYAINKSRSLRVKAFNAYDTDEIISGSVQRIGAALLITKDFEHLPFFRKKKDSSQPPSSAHAPQNPSSD